MSQKKSSVSVFWPFNFALNAPEGNVLKVLIAARCSGNPPAPSLQYHPITSPLWKIIDTPPILQCYPLDNKMFWQITKKWMIPYSIPCRRKTKIIQYWLIVTSKNSRLKFCYIFKFKHSNDQNIYISNCRLLLFSKPQMNTPFQDVPQFRHRAVTGSTYIGIDLVRYLSN